MTPDMSSESALYSWEDFLSQHGSTWDELAEQASPDLTRAWSEALIRSRGLDTGNVHVFARLERGSVTTILPLVKKKLSRLGVPIRWIEPLLNINCLHHGILTVEGLSNINGFVLDMLEQNALEWDILTIEELVRDTELDIAWSNACDRRQLKTHASAGLNSPFLTIDCGWDEFLARKSSSFRYNMRRKIKKLSSYGQLDVQWLTAPEDTTSILEAIAIVEDQSWKKGAGTAIVSRHWEKTFYKEVLTRLAGQGKVLGTVLKLNGSPVAYDLSLINHRKGFCLKTSFDSNYYDLAPGIVLRAFLMERIFSIGLIEYDFLGAAERYKREWTETIREHYALSIYNSTLRSKALYYAQQLTGRLRRIRQPRLIEA